jgi:hypothetical protein
MLESASEWAEVTDLLLVEELEERLDLANEFLKLVQKGDKRFQLSSTALVAFYILPISQLRSGLADRRAVLMLQKHIRGVERATHRCKSRFYHVPLLGAW